MFTDVRNAKILPWIREYIDRTSPNICKKNQNDHDPQIEFLNLTNERQEKVWVHETAVVGHLVSVISVTDLDLEDRGGAVLTITEGNEEGQFSLDSVGDVHVIRVAGRGQLDRVITSQYQLTVQAEDRGTPPRSSTATLTVNINPCEVGQECIQGDSCERFKAEKQKLNRLSQGSDEWKMLLEKLKSQVCNKEEKKICCDLPRPGNILTLHFKSFQSAWSLCLFP